MKEQKYRADRATINRQAKKEARDFFIEASEEEAVIDNLREFDWDNNGPESFLEKIPAKFRFDADFWEKLFYCQPGPDFEPAFRLIELLPPHLTGDYNFINEFAAWIYLEPEYLPQDLAEHINKEWLREAWMEKKKEDLLFTNAKNFPWQLFSEEEGRDFFRVFSENFRNLEILLKARQRNQALDVLYDEEWEEMKEQNFRHFAQNMDFFIVKKKEESRWSERKVIKELQRLRQLQELFEQIGMAGQPEEEIIVRTYANLSRITNIENFSPEPLSLWKKIAGDGGKLSNLDDYLVRESFFLKEIVAGDQTRAREWLALSSDKERKRLEDWQNDFGSIPFQNVPEASRLLERWTKMDSPPQLAEGEKTALLKTMIEDEYKYYDQKIIALYEKMVGLLGGSEEEEMIFWQYMGRQDRAEALQDLDNFMDIITLMEGPATGIRAIKSLIRDIKGSENKRSRLREIFLGMKNTMWEKMKQKSVYPGQESPLKDFDEIDVNAVYNEMKVHKIEEAIKGGNSDEIIGFEPELELQRIRAMTIPKKGKATKSEIQEKRAEKRSLLRELRKKAHIQEAILFQIPELVRLYLEKFPEAGIDEVYENLPVEMNLLSLRQRKILQKKIRTYIEKRGAVKKYAALGKSDPIKLLEKALWVPTGTLEGRVELEPYQGSLVFTVFDDDTFDSFSYRKSSSTLGWAFDSSRIEELAGTLVMIRHIPDNEFRRKVVSHENRHQEDRFFFETDLPIQRAKTEIIAYLEEGFKPFHIIALLTEEGGIYDYFFEERKNARTLKEKEAEESRWQAHCQQVTRAVWLAKDIGNYDALSITPIQRWRHLREHPGLQS